MMHRGPFVFLGAPFEKRKICDPKEIPDFTSERELLHLRDTQPQAAQDFAGDSPLVSRKKNAISLIDVQFRLQSGILSATKKFHDRRFPFALLNLDESKAFRAVQFCNFG